MIERLGTERLLEIVGEIDVAFVVNAFAGRETQQLLDAVDAVVRQAGRARLQINRVIPLFAELANDLREL